MSVSDLASSSTLLSTKHPGPSSRRPSPTTLLAGEDERQPAYGGDVPPRSAARPGRAAAEARFEPAWPLDCFALSLPFFLTGIPRLDGASAGLSSDAIHLRESVDPVPNTWAAMIREILQRPRLLLRPFDNAIAQDIESVNMRMRAPWFNVLRNSCFRPNTIALPSRVTMCSPFRRHPRLPTTRQSDCTKLLDTSGNESRYCSG